MNSGYMLVKDKNGEFKYFKDGKYFSVEEVKALQGRFAVKPIAPASQGIKQSETEPMPIIPEKKATPTPLENISVKKPAPVLTNLDERRIADQKIVEEKANNVIEKLRIKFSDEKIKTRFTNVLITYFRGIRVAKEVEYVLTLPKISGGLELPPDKANIIIAFLENLSVETSRERKNIVAARPIEDYSRKKITDFEHQLEPAPPAVIKPAFKFDVPIPPLAPKPAPAKIVPKQPIIKPQPAAVKPIEPQAKPKMTDVKQSETHLVGPLEELGEMDLDNFRRLGKTPKEIIDEVLEKIELLSEQSFAKKLQGIKAWKSSPIFQMYLSMNMEGILQGKSIGDVIKARQIENKETLTLGEYETINEISRKISS